MNIETPATGFGPGKKSAGLRNISAFTLVELLVVISIIGILAAFILAVTGGVKKTEYVSTATAEMNKIKAALEAYKQQYGFYPPMGNNCLINPLYAELAGTTNVSQTGTPAFSTLDGNMQGLGPGMFGMSGFVNCSKSGAGGENSAVARDFIGELKPAQIYVITNSAGTNGMLVYSLGGPNINYAPVATNLPGINPWRYAYPGTNNPNSYDLWVQLEINNQTNLVCNWSSKVQVGAPYP
ncbi:MAG TPA: type II secretion system protein [Verrucomicrobiae bacterium]